MQLCAQLFRIREKSNTFSNFLKKIKNLLNLSSGGGSGEVSHFDTSLFVVVYLRLRAVGKCFMFDYPELTRKGQKLSIQKYFLKNTPKSTFEQFQQLFSSLLAGTCRSWRLVSTRH